MFWLLVEMDRATIPVDYVQGSVDPGDLDQKVCVNRHKGVDDGH